MNDLKFIQVGELAKGISEHLLPDSDILSGEIWRLFFENGTIIRFCFEGIHFLTWEILEGPDRRRKGSETYRLTCIRDHIGMVDYVCSDRPATSVSLIVDFTTQAVTRVVGALPNETRAKRDLFSLAAEGLPLTAVTVDFSHGTVDKPFTPESPRHIPTTEMLGKRYQYVYSRTETYEHIYLNENLYTWHCLAGIEKGLADTDRCHYYKIDRSLYLFVWHEKIIPTLGVVLLDWRQMKTNGKLFGYESNDFGRLSNTPIGAFAAKLNETKYK